MKVFSLIITVLLVTINKVQAEEEDSYRLPGTSFPNHYDLALTIDIDQGSFNGSVIIDLNVTEPVTMIKLNHEFTGIIFNFSKASLVNTASEQEYEFTGIFFDPPREMVGIIFDGTIDIGNYKLELWFYQIYISTDLKGLYLSSYYNDGVKTNISTSFFASIYARSVFPCYDEPHYKATYSIEITHKSDFHALSNMPIIDITEVPNTDFVVTKFEKTPLISTYLLAFIVSNFDAHSNEADNFTIYSPPNAISDTLYASEFGQASLQALENYFQSSYQLPKVTLVAIDDFLMGAMENWGLITFLSSRLLYNPLTTDEKSLQTLTKVITHELAHQWFGNEVTCYWWSAVWLNEGFASLFEDIITDILKPEWRLMEQFVVNTMQPVMVLDSYKNEKFMNAEVHTLDEMKNIYDFVAYKKAASVIRMIQHAMTESVFQTAMQEYIKDRSYNVATPDNLINILQKTVDTSNQSTILPAIRSVLTTWTDNPGFPMITITRDYIGKTVSVTQQRFITSPTSNSIPDLKFYVPINYATAANPDFSDTMPSQWVKPIDSALKFSLEISDNDWVIFNKQATGYYRVNYDDNNWRLIIKDMNSKNYEVISSTNRAQLVDDALNLAKTGYLSYEISLDLIKYLQLETDYVPIVSALNNLKDLERRLRGQNTSITDFMMELVEHLYDDVRLTISDSDDHIRRLLRMDIALFACKFGLEKCLNDAYDIFSKNIESSIHVDIRPAVFCGAMRHPIFGDIDFVQLQYHLINLTATEELRRKHEKEIGEILDGMGCAIDEDIQRMILNMTIYGRESINFEQSYYNKLFSAVVDGSYSGTQVALQFMKEHIQEIEDQYESIIKVYQSIGSNVVTTELQNLLNEVVDAHINSVRAVDPKVIEAAETAVEIAEENVSWTSKHSEIINTWLEERDRIEPEPDVAQLLYSKKLIIFNSLLAFCIVKFNS